MRMPVDPPAQTTADNRINCSERGEGSINYTNQPDAARGGWRPILQLATAVADCVTDVLHSANGRSDGRLRETADWRSGTAATPAPYGIAALAAAAIRAFTCPGRGRQAARLREVHRQHESLRRRDDRAGAGRCRRRGGVGRPHRADLPLACFEQLIGGGVIDYGNRHAVYLKCGHGSLLRILQ